MSRTSSGIPPFHRRLDLEMCGVYINVELPQDVLTTVSQILNITLSRVKPIYSMWLINTWRPTERSGILA